MRFPSVIVRLLGVERTVVERVEFADEALVVHVRPTWAERRRCGVCRRRCTGYDAGAGRRRWRGLDWATTKVLLEADAPRVECFEHGVAVAAVPWARHGSRHTRAFEDTCAWLATHTSRTATAELLRVAWRTVTGVCERVAAEAEASTDRFANLRRIGIDEVAHRKGHRYITVVVDHDTGRLIWGAKGKDAATLEGFFDLLGDERNARIEAVSADAAPWIETVVGARCENAQLCMDPFHVVAWATKALDEVRREVWNEARRQGQTAIARELKGARFALWKNPEDLSERQAAKLSSIQRTNRTLYRAYLLKEQLRQVFRLPWRQAMRLLDRWIAWALRCRIPAFVEVARSVARHRAGIEHALRRDLSNARIESLNTRIRVLTRQAFGFGSPEAMIAMAMLALGGLCPPLPGRG
ncbi:MAG: ISL3 family transposase [bacterium]